ncbi:uncharacterized protein [Physcomitrium patens]|uniref:uncharacterized protein n=1 Tax=Physcomitrium patens TaxID=3218 RepID=UPI003CCD2784
MSSSGANCIQWCVVLHLRVNIPVQLSAPEIPYTQAAKNVQNTTTTTTTEHVGLSLSPHTLDGNASVTRAASLF